MCRKDCNIKPQYLMSAEKSEAEKRSERNKLLYTRRWCKVNLIISYAFMMFFSVRMCRLNLPIPALQLMFVAYFVFVGNSSYYSCIFCVLLHLVALLIMCAMLYKDNNNNVMQTINGGFECCCVYFSGFWSWVLSSMYLIE